MFTMSKIYQVVSPDSAEQGEYAETGFEYEDREFSSLWELADEIRGAGHVECSSSSAHATDWYTTVNPEIDYNTGDSTTYSYHPQGLTDKQAIGLRVLLNMNDRMFRASKPE